MNVISKADLVDKEDLERVLDMDSAAMVSRMGHMAAHGRLQPLTRTIASVVDDYTLVGFLPLDPNDEDSIDTVLTQVDMVRGLACVYILGLLFWLGRTEHARVRIHPARLCGRTIHNSRSSTGRIWSHGSHETGRMTMTTRRAEEGR